MKKLLIPVVMICLLTSCNNYYKAALGTKPFTAGSIDDPKMKNRYFILRSGSQAFVINNITFDNDRKTMHCKLDSLPYEHKLHLRNGRNGKMKYKKSINAPDEDETAVLNEVHIYISPDTGITTGPYTVAFDQIQKIEILEKDKVKTNVSHTIGICIGVGITLLSVVGFVALIGSSMTIL